MSKCWNCGIEFTLKNENIKCDECKVIVNFQCHSCHEWFSLYNEKTKEKIKQCGICGFFPCSHCGTCGQYCEKDLWQTQIIKILAPEITYQKVPNLQEKINKLLSYIEDIKISHDRRTCPNNVSISYAKQKIKNCAVKMLGCRVKNEKDKLKFLERYTKIIDVDLGTKLTINQSREEGSYGQEYRDAFNYAICRGKLKKEIIKKEIDNEIKEIEVYHRIENGHCQYLDLTNLIIKKCPNSKCKKEYKYESQIEYCHHCQWKKGKHKGEYPKLKLIISNKDTCQLNRGLFKKDGKR
ncbi:MAG: hypothetical protein WC679_12355 [Bacteroidales bacterium]|jgi:hypothetical protein